MTLIPVLPPAMRKAGEAVAAAAKRVVAHSTRAVKWADDAERARRVAICQACPHLRRSTIERCGKCGCPIRGKAAFLRATCPDKRW